MPPRDASRHIVGQLQEILDEALVDFHGSLFERQQCKVSGKRSRQTAMRASAALPPRRLVEVDVGLIQPRDCRKRGGRLPCSERTRRASGPRMIWRRRGRPLPEIMITGGWRSPQMPAHYARKLDARQTSACARLRIVPASNLGRKSRLTGTFAICSTCALPSTHLDGPISSGSA